MCGRYSVLTEDEIIEVRSVLLYVCGGGVMPLLRAWLFAGMGYGDALAFMLAGPATKIMNLAAAKMMLILFFIWPMFWGCADR